ncbi:carbohydrate-binding module family 20 domain-containing protein [Streptomyces sp. NPDC102406]|uniref:carbohydrate-binding module family 20 domain-containing protein n=1 Tax=Streptomyces sp. NPDC102406 TaxID=3366171 RepID=UPI00380174FE
MRPIPTPPPRRKHRTATVLAVGALALGGVVTLPAQTASAADTGVRNGDVIANLWSWNWKSVAKECTDVLDPAGYGAVQVAPPEESLKQTDYLWWDVYQPYSYSLDSRFGSAADFKSMIDTCHAAGVEVYTDAVINHTAAQTGTGYAGTRIGNKYDTPDFDPADSDDCTKTIANWGDQHEVQHCELLGMPDLDTSEPGVRAKIVGFLNKQIDLGVDGFRVDAAKHIDAADMRAMVGALHTTKAGDAPYITQEVYPGNPPALGDYYASGDVLDFTYAAAMKAQFGGGDIANLASFGSSWGLANEADSNSFVTNHDTERNGYSLSYKDGATAVLANVFHLARGYGRPSVYAAWNFGQSDEAPPNSGGFVSDTNCSSGWTCLDRDTAVSGMIAWHNAVAGASVAHWQSPASNVIGFSRGGGFVALNNSSSAHTYTYTTGLADGTYKNVIDGGATSVTVSGGRAALTVPAKGAVAFYDGTYDCKVNCGGGDGGSGGGTTVTASFTEYAPTTPGSDVYVVGSTASLGSWNTANAVKLSSAGYPLWKKDIAVPAASSIEYKYLKKDSAGNVTWESNANRTLRTSSSPAAVNNSWNLADANATDVRFTASATTGTGTNVYVTGSLPSLGSWNPDDAIPLSSASSPSWGRTVIVPKGTTFTYKYLKKDASGNVTWESGADRSLTTGSGTGYTVNDTWK